MTVLMTLKVAGDPQKLLARAKENPQSIQDIAERGKQAGALHHRFWASGDTIFVVDEWPDAESFQKFFDSSPDIQQLMAEVGVTTAPEITFWEQLDTGDDF